MIEYLKKENNLLSLNQIEKYSVYNETIKPISLKNNELLKRLALESNKSQEVNKIIYQNIPVFKQSNTINADSALREKHSLPSFKEWSNSFYAFNEKNIVNSAVLDTFVTKFVKSYFWLNPLMKGKKSSSRRQIRIKRLSLNRILSSKPEIKQTNNKTVITVYVYNRNKKYSFLKLNDLRINQNFDKLNKGSNNHNNKSIIPKSSNNKLQLKNIIRLPFSVLENDKVSLIKFPNTNSNLSLPSVNLKENISPSAPSSKFNINPLNLKKITLNKRKIKLIKRKSLFFLNNLDKHKSLFMKAFKLNNKYFNFYKNKHFNSYLKKLYKREMLYLYYIKIISINNVKYKNWFLLGLKNILSNLYKKNVEFNIVNLKYLHYNSNVLTEAVSIKLKNRNNRLLRVLKKAIGMVRIPQIDPMLYKNKTVNQEISKSNDLISILKDIKYKTVNGVRIEAAGRLSKRLTASRSVFKYKYKGTLKNIESSYGGISSKISRGHVKQNVQFIKVDSKTRNGAFGLKGWISSF